MKVLYNNLEIKNGIFLTPLESRIEPKIKYNAKPNSLYTLIMHDPDAVVGNYFHWLVVNIPGDKINNGDKIFKYKGPAPPKGSGIHRYMFLLYEQPERINARFSARAMTMDDFYENLHTNLHSISKIYFTSKNQDGGKTRNTKSRKRTKTRKNTKTRKSTKK